VGLRIDPRDLAGPPPVPSPDLGPGEFERLYANYQAVVESMRPRAAELQSQGDWLTNFFVKGTPLGVPNALILLLVLAAILALVLHGSVWGRYLFAVGSNEQAARYAGIRTDRVKILSYVICSTFAALAACCTCLSSAPRRRRTPGRCWNCTRSPGRSSAAVACAAASGRCGHAARGGGAAALEQAVQLHPLDRQRAGVHRHRLGTAARTVANELIGRWRK